MEDEIIELNKKLSEVWSALNKLNNLDLSKIQYSNISSETFDKINFADVSFRSNLTLFNKFLTELSVERAIRQRVKKRFYVLNDKDTLTIHTISSTPPREFFSEFDAFEWMQKQNKLSESSYKRKLRRNKSTYTIHSYDKEKDVFVKYSEEDLKNLEQRYFAAMHGIF